MARTSDPLSKFYRRLRRSEDTFDREDMWDTGERAPHAVGTVVELRDRSGYHDYQVVIAYPRMIGTIIGTKVGVAMPGIGRTSYGLEDLDKFEYAPVRDPGEASGVFPETAAKREMKRTVQTAKDAAKRDYNPSGTTMAKKKPSKKRSNPKSTLDKMAWHPDPLVRDIYSEIDDRDESEIAESIMEVYEGYDRNIRSESDKPNKRLTRDELIDAATLASQIVDWANYANAYGDYSDPPWERDENPRRKGTNKRAKKATARKKASKKRRNQRDWWTPGQEWMQRAAESEYKSQLAAHIKRGRRKSTFRYIPPDWQRDAVEALGRNDEEAFKSIKLSQIGYGPLESRHRASKKKGNMSGDGAQLLTLPDKYSGGKIYLWIRDGAVVGAMGTDPDRYIGRTVEDARHMARYGGKRSKKKGKRKNPTSWNEDWHPIGVIGDSDPIEHWGGVIYDTPYGPTMLYFQQTEGTVYVHRHDIDDNVMSDLDWVDWEGVSEYVDTSVAEIRKAAKSDNVLARAQVYEAVSSYHGWSNLDDTPQVMTLEEAEDKYGPDVDAAHEHENKARNPSCRAGQLLVKRQGYTRHDGVKVKPTSFCITDRGKKGRGPDIVPDLREGKLGGPGYTDKAASTRRKILMRCVKQYGYRSCLGSLQYLLLVGKREWPKSKLKKVESDKAWLMKNYGGPGSFGPEDNPRRIRLASRLSNP